MTSKDCTRRSAGYLECDSICLLWKITSLLLGNHTLVLLLGRALPLSFLSSPNDCSKCMWHTLFPGKGLPLWPRTVKCLPLSATMHSKDCAIPMKANPNTIGINIRRVGCICTHSSVLLSAMLSRCLYSTSQLPLCISERCELITRPSHLSAPQWEGLGGWWIKCHSLYGRLCANLVDEGIWDEEHTGGC